MTTLEQERGFYDANYARYLALPDHALRVDRGVLERNLDNPGHPFFERRRLYRAAMRALLAAAPRGLRVLDYGCGPADFGVWLATEGAAVTLLDLSPAAIELGLKRAAASEVRVRGVAADAIRLEMFQTGEFDLVFACAALHHTLKYGDAVSELARVLRPGGRLVLCETWGGNPLLNIARRLRARFEHEAEEQGEEILMDRGHLQALEPWFEPPSIEHLNLLAMGKRLLRGKFGSAAARATVAALERADAALFALLPGAREWCGEAVIEAVRSNRAAGQGEKT